MKIVYLQEFIVLCEYMNFTKAAKRLYVTQPVLSNHINAMEQELGVKLFSRDQHRIRMTEYGESVLSGAKEIIKHYEAMTMRIKIQQTGQFQSVSIGYLYYAYQNSISRLTELASISMPDTALSLYSSGYQEIATALQDNDIDVALTIDCDPSIEDTHHVEVIQHDSLQLAVGNTHPLARRRSVLPRELNDLTLLLPNHQTTGQYADRLNEILEFNDIHPSAVSSFNDVFSRTAELQTGRVASIVMGHFKEILGDSVRLIPIDGDNMELDLAAIWKKSNLNPNIPKIVELLRTIL
jgi:DNA-binding transcriptional LysR family regulator